MNEDSVSTELQGRRCVALPMRPPRGVPGVDRPPVTTLCGSTRFIQAFQDANFQLTLAGHIVLTIGCDSKRDVGLSLTETQKAQLDELHKRKIELADQVLILDVPIVDPTASLRPGEKFVAWERQSVLADMHGVPHLPYVGESTAREARHAAGQGKPTYWLSGGGLAELLAKEWRP